MDADFFSFLFNAFLFVGVVVAIKDRSRINGLLLKLTHLQKVIDFQTSQIEKLKKALKELAPPEESSKQKALLDVSEAAIKVDTNETKQNPSLETTRLSEIFQQNSGEHTVEKPVQSSQHGFSLDSLLKGNGIFWLGGLVLAIGGVFLAKYSIEAGLLPPSVRVILGAIFGVTLVATAETLNRFKEKFKINTPYIPAALASGGVITCFAMALVSFDFYHFITPNLAFILLALISLVATYLALRFGPVLAGIGIIGSYTVPALVSTGSNNVMALLLYVSFVSLSAVWVAEYVKQKWVWWLSFAGHFIWFVGAIVMGGKSDFAVITLFTFVSLYLYVLASILGWKLNLGLRVALSVKELLMPRKEQLVILLSLCLFALFLRIYPEFIHLIWAALFIGVLALVVSYRHSALDTWPFLALAFVLCAFSLMPDSVDFANNLFPFNGKYLFVQLAVVTGSGFSLFMIKRFADRVAYLLLLVLTPLSLFGISYITSPSAAENFLYPVWTFEMLLIGAAASYGAMKSQIAIQQVTFLVLANSMLTLCFTMLLSASTLTLAIAAQVASMSYLSWKFKVKIPDWLYKVALLVVVTRLTLSPWLADYKDESIFGMHWTLVIYPVVLGIIWFSSKFNLSKILNRWFMGVFIHLIALLITTETSYILVGDYPDFFDLSYKEAVLLSLNWLILSVVYMWRSKLTSSSKKVYQIAGIALLLGFALIHLDISVVNNPFVDNRFVGLGFFNWLWLHWLIPAVLFYLYIGFKLSREKYQNAIFAVIALFGLLFVNGEIRNLFNNGYIFWGTPLKQAELYTYSIVWLIISTTAIFSAQHFNNRHLTNVGFMGLSLVILKAFVIDMSHLEGLLRALSFIGLGICLVGIGWLFQKMQGKPALNEAQS